jgi:hypothetical protein
MYRICLVCDCQISLPVFEYSTENFGVPLCMSHQRYIEDIERKTTPQTLNLYFALRGRGVPAALEKFDGFKTIDIAITEARVNIEVDGMHHQFDPQQALADLKRTYFSFQKGYLTLRIPNALVEWDLETTADFITEFLNIATRNKTKS